MSSNNNYPSNTNYGPNTLQYNTSGQNNTAIGSYTLSSNTTGSSNVGLGTNASLKNRTGSFNTALGTATLCFNEAGGRNTAVGSNTLEYCEGSNNTGVGTQSLFNIIDGNNNTALGENSGFNASNIESCTFIGCDSGVADGIINYVHSTAIGCDSTIDASFQIVLGTSDETIKIPGTVDSITLSNGSINPDPNGVVQKYYVDSISTGVVIKNPCACATTTVTVLSGLQTIDGYVLEVGDRVLVWLQGTDSLTNNQSVSNGIYDASAGDWSRSVDMSGGSNANNVSVLVLYGTE